MAEPNEQNTRAFAEAWVSTLSQQDRDALVGNVRSLADIADRLGPEAIASLKALWRAYEVIDNAGFGQEYAERHLTAALMAGKQGEELVRYAHHLVGLASALR